MADFGYDVCRLHRHPPALRHPRRLRPPARRGAPARAQGDPRLRAQPHAPTSIPGSSNRAPRGTTRSATGTSGATRRRTAGRPTTGCSVFGGSGWEWDEATGQYYYHAFLKEQPDLNWRNPEVVAAMHDAMRFWLDRGVDGFRVDVIWHLIKDDQFRDNPPNPGYAEGMSPYRRLLPVYTTDRPEVHDVIARHAQRARRVRRAHADRRDLPADRAAGDLLRRGRCGARTCRSTSSSSSPPWDAADDRPADRGVRGGAAGGRLAELGARQPRQPAHRRAGSARRRRASPRCCC